MVEIQEWLTEIYTNLNSVVCVLLVSSVEYTCLHVSSTSIRNEDVRDDVFILTQHSVDVKNYGVTIELLFRRSKKISPSVNKSEPKLKRLWININTYV